MKKFMPTNSYSVFLVWIFNLCGLATIFLFMFDISGNPLIERKYTGIQLSDINILGMFLSNFNHAGPIHLLLNMLFLRSVYKATVDSPFLQKHVKNVIYLGVIIIPIISYFILLVTHPEDTFVIGFSGVLCALLGLLLGIEFPKTWGYLIYIIGFHVVFIFGLNIPIAWEVHLAGFIVGYLYQLKFNVANIKELSIRNVLNTYTIETFKASEPDEVIEMGIFDFLNSYNGSDKNKKLRTSEKVFEIDESINLSDEEIAKVVKRFRDSDSSNLIELMPLIQTIINEHNMLTETKLFRVI